MLWQLDAARGAAASYVAASHLCRNKIHARYPDLPDIFAFGQEAVILFFLLSGFVIHWSVAHKPNLGFAGYLRARAVRIYPLFLLTLCLAYLVAGQSDPRTSWLILLGNIFMLQDHGFLKPGVWFEVYAGVLVLWSLSYEWWFYMLYFPISKRIPAPAQAWLVAGISLSQLPVYFLAPNQASRFLLYFSIWWTGVELARVKLAGLPVGPRSIAVSLGTLSLIVAGLGCAVWQTHAAGLSMRPGLHPFLELRHFMAALALTGGALLWRQFRWIGFRTLFGVFIPIAPFSYALYLLHEPLALHAHLFGFVMHPQLELLLSALFVLTVAWLAEKYVQAWCRRILLP